MSDECPPFDQRTKTQKAKWRHKLNENKNSTFTWTSSGWKDVCSRYETDTVEITLRVRTDGALGCQHCIERSAESGWFGISSTSRGEYHANRHVCSFHQPNKNVKTPLSSRFSTHTSPKRTTNLFAYFNSPNKSPIQQSQRPPITNVQEDDTATHVPPPPPEQNQLPTSLTNASNKQPEQLKGQGQDSVDTSNEPIQTLSAQSQFVAPCQSRKYNALSRYFNRSENSRGSLHTCPGIEVHLPLPREHNYPFFIHDIMKDLPFIFDLEIKNVRSINCERLSETALISCNPCKMLLTNVELKNLAARSKDQSFHESRSKNSFLTYQQMVLKLDHANQTVNDLKLQLLNNNRKQGVLCKKLDTTKLLQISIAKGDVPRIHQIMYRVLNEQRSITSCLEMMNKARAGIYTPKGYNEEDYDLALLHKNLGSPRLVYANQRSRKSGGPCMSGIKTNAYFPKYKGCTGEIDRRIIQSNFDKFLFSEKMRSEVSLKKKCLNVIMIDDIKGEKRLRVEETTTSVYGLCYHAYENNISTELNSADDCRSIRQALDDGKAHYATEITNVAIGAIRETGYQPIVVATSAGCQGDDPIERTMKLVKVSISIYVNDPRGEQTQGRLSTIQPDGASAFVRVCHSLFFSEELKNDHPLYRHLNKLPLFPMFTGKDVFRRITLGCDMKHVFKRTRERMKSQNGIQLFNHRWTAEVLRSLLIASGESKESVAEMFVMGFADAMNVPAMVRLFKSIARMSIMDSNEFGKLGPQVHSFRKEFKLLGIYCDLIHKLLVEKLSLCAHVENISTLIHINLVCYRRNGTHMIASQNFSNHQRLYRSILWSIANAKEDNIDEYFLFQDANDRLEELYGLLRTTSGGAKGNGSGMDVLQCCERMCGTMQVAGVFARNPELAKASRHLKTTDDHQNPRSYLSTGGSNMPQDHSRIDVTSVNLQNRYINGRDDATKILREVGYEDDDMDWRKMASDGIDFLRPHKKFVGINETDDEIKSDECDNIKSDECDGKCG